MKCKLAVVTVIASSLFFFSCRRDYSCHCYHSPSTIDRDNKLGRIPKADAEDICNRIKTNQMFDTCYLASVK